MGLELIVGPANAGKVALLYSRFLATLDEGRPTLLVVPGAAARRRAEADLLARRPVLLGGRVLAFDELVEEIAARAGVARPRLGGAARLVALRRLDERLGRPLGRAPGTVEAIARALDRLGSAGLEPAALPPGDARLATLARIQAAWWEELDRLGATDLARLRATAPALLARDPAAWDGEELLVEGFDDLSPSQAAVIHLVAWRGHVVATLPYVQGRQAFLAVQPAATALQGQARVLPALAGLRPVEPVVRELVDDAAGRPAVLRAVAERLAEEAPRTPAPEPDEDALALIAVAGARAEADVVLAEVVRALAEGVPPDGIAVIAPGDPRATRRGVVAALVRAGIPVAGGGAQPLPATPFGTALLRLLRTAWSPDATRADLFAFLRSPWSGRARASVDRAEAWTRRRAQHDLAEVLAAIDRDIGTLPRPLRAAQADGPASEAAAGAVRAMLAAAHTLDGRATGHDAAADARAAAAALRTLAEVARVAPDATRIEVVGALERTQAAGVPAAGVHVVDARGARGLSVDVAIVLGLEDGRFGAGAAADPLLAGIDGVGEALPVDAARHLLYVAVTRARRRLAVVWRAADDDGRPLPQTALADDLARALGATRLVPQRTRGLADVAFAVEDAPTGRERARAVARLAVADLERARHVAIADGIRPRLDRAVNARERHPRPTGARARAHLAARVRFGITEIERFADCSAWWFAERFLDPVELDRALADPRVRGTIAHAALAEFHRRVPGEFGRDHLRPDDADRAVALVGRLVREALERQRLPVVTLDDRLVERRLLRDLARVVRAECARPSPLAPRYIEKSIEVGLGDGLTVSGKVDRIDAEAMFPTHAVVWDYKSGATITPGARLLAEGRVQLPLYLRAARDQLGLEPVAGFYRALRTGAMRGIADGSRADELPPGLVSTDIVDHGAFTSLLDEAVELAAGKAERIRRGDVRHDPISGSCPAHCPWPGVCRVRDRRWS